MPSALTAESDLGPAGEMKQARCFRSNFRTTSLEADSDGDMKLIFFTLMAACMLET